MLHFVAILTYSGIDVDMQCMQVREIRGKRERMIGEMWLEEGGKSGALCNSVWDLTVNFLNLGLEI